MANRIQALRPPYPVYGPNQYQGNLPPPIGGRQPVDMFPSGYNPAYAAYAGAHGRNLAGLGSLEAPKMDTADEGIKDYPNELDALQIADDVQGNGMFDPAGSHGNVHPDAGIFAAHYNLPGYEARAQFYTPSEVTDITTGGKVMYVPNNAPAIDHAQRVAFEDLRLWQLPPGVNPYKALDVPGDPTVFPNDPAWPVGQADTSKAGSYLAWSIIGGAAVGLVAGIMWKRRKK